MGTEDAPGTAPGLTRRLRHSRSTVHQAPGGKVEPAMARPADADQADLEVVVDRDPYDQRQLEFPPSDN